MCQKRKKDKNVGTINLFAIAYVNPYVFSRISIEEESLYSSALDFFKSCLDFLEKIRFRLLFFPKLPTKMRLQNRDLKGGTLTTSFFSSNCLLKWLLPFDRSWFEDENNGIVCQDCMNHSQVVGKNRAKSAIFIMTSFAFGCIFWNLVFFVV